jgi:hypothetical protein
MSPEYYVLALEIMQLWLLESEVAPCPLRGRLLVKVDICSVSLLPHLAAANERVRVDLQGMIIVLPHGTPRGFPALRDRGCIALHVEEAICDTSEACGGCIDGTGSLMLGKYY